MNELFGEPRTHKQNEYQKAYSMIYSFTNDKKLQDKLKEYVDFRIHNCTDKGYRFYSSSIKSFLDSINEQMSCATVDEIWEAVNFTLSYPSIRLLVPYKSKNKCVDNVQSEHKTDYTPALDENGNPIVF